MAALQNQNVNESTAEEKTTSDEMDESKPRALSRLDFEINYKDTNQLTKDIHFVANSMFPLNDTPYTEDSNISDSNYTLTVVQGGITNLLFLMTPKLENDDNNNNNDDGDLSPNKLLIRIYGENTEVLIDRDREEKLFHELGSISFGPRCFGLFGNGRIEQWYDNAHSIQLHERKHCPKIMSTLAQMHCLHPVLLKEEKSSSALWTTLDKWYGIASNVDFKEDDEEKQTKYDQLNWKQIPKHLEWIKMCLPSERNQNDITKLLESIIDRQPDEETKQTVAQRLKSKLNLIAWEFLCEPVFSHNDLLGGNVLYLQDSKEIKFVDFEYGAYNYRAFDFANHFCEYAGFDCDWKKHFPEKEHMKQCLNEYVQTLCGNEQSKGATKKEVVDLFDRKSGFTDKDYAVFLDFCVDVICVFTSADHFFWGLWGVVQAKHSPIDFDFIQYANDRLLSGYQHSLTLLPEYIQSMVNAK